MASVGDGSRKKASAIVRLQCNDGWESEWNRKLKETEIGLLDDCVIMILLCYMDVNETAASRCASDIAFGTLAASRPAIGVLRIPSTATRTSHPSGLAFGLHILLLLLPLCCYLAPSLRLPSRDRPHTIIVRTSESVEFKNKKIKNKKT